MAVITVVVDDSGNIADVVRSEKSLLKEGYQEVRIVRSVINAFRYGTPVGLLREAQLIHLAQDSIILDDSLSKERKGDLLKKADQWELGDSVEFAKVSALPADVRRQIDDSGSRVAIIVTMESEGKPPKLAQVVAYFIDP